MVVRSGVARLVATGLYAVAFVSSLFIIGSTAWFIHEFDTSEHDHAVIGLASAGALYSFIAMIFTCCLVGVRFFAFLAVVLDFAFFAVYIAIAVLRKEGTEECRGRGDYHTGCHLYKACLAVAILSVFCFFVNMLLSTWFVVRGNRKAPPAPAQV